MDDAARSKLTVLCLVEGCEDPKTTRGMCRRHYQRWARTKEGRAGVRSHVPADLLTLPLEETEKAYLAGLIDGDGSITWRDTERRYWSVKVNMTDREIIDYLLTIGGTQSQQLHKNRSRTLYGWYLSRQAHVHDFLAAVSPYLKTYAKQARAREAIMRIEARTQQKP